MTPKMTSTLLLPTGTSSVPKSNSDGVISRGREGEVWKVSDGSAKVVLEKVVISKSESRREGSIVSIRLSWVGQER